MAIHSGGTDDETGAGAQRWRRPRRVAIACQGGGSHTAFTAGVLRALVASDDVEVVGLSGTSGGGICALLAWYGLATGGRDEAARLLDDFWRDMSARPGVDAITNDWLVGLARLGHLVSMPAANPYDYPPVASTALTQALERHVDFARVAALPPTTSPLLLIGAVDVISGDFHEFSSADGDISAAAIVASATIPTLFRATRIGEHLYWDGLFSRNPPVHDLPETGAEEIWVIRINPRALDGEPRTATDIADRRNQLAGNLSLEQELSFIRTINELVDEGHLVGTRHRHIDVREIVLPHRLDVASKLDRRPRFVAGLVADGERTGRRFLEELPPAWADLHGEG